MSAELVVDRWRAWKAARYWSRRLAKATSDEEKRRAYAQMIAHLKAALGAKPHKQAEQLRLLD